jgi:hypothetical protein
VEKEVIGEPKAVAQPPEASKPEAGEARVNGKASGGRYASDEQFGKAHRKTSALHAGLFRRLSK